MLFVAAYLLIGLMLLALAFAKDTDGEIVAVVKMQAAVVGIHPFWLGLIGILFYLIAWPFIKIAKLFRR